MTSATGPTSSRAALALVAALLAGAAQLVVGFFYLSSGLVAPLWAIVVLLAWWVVQSVALVRLALRRSYWVLAVPVVAAVTWFAALSLGAWVFDWTP